MIDLDVHCGRWPFLQYGPTEPEALRAQLQRAGIRAAHVSASEAILAPDPSVEERRLHRQIAGLSFFRHAPLVNPLLSNGKDALRRAREQYGSRLVKILPTYHRYDLQDPALLEWMQEAAKIGLTVALLMRVEDERTHYPLMKVPAPPVEAVRDWARALAPLPLLICNAYFREIERLGAAADNLRFDFPFAEGADPMRQLLDAVGAGRLLFASHAPFLYPLAQANKLKRGGLPAAMEAKIGSGNAEALLDAQRAVPGPTSAGSAR